MVLHEFGLVHGQTEADLDEPEDGQRLLPWVEFAAVGGAAFAKSAGVTRCWIGGSERGARRRLVAPRRAFLRSGWSPDDPRRRASA